MSNPSFIQKNLSQGIRVKRLNDKEKIEKIVDRINFWEHKEVISDEHKDDLIKEIKEIIEYRYYKY